MQGPLAGVARALRADRPGGSRTALLLCALLAPTTSRAQTTDAQHPAPPNPTADVPPPAPTPLRTMSLDEALRYAREHNPQVRAATARIRMRQAEAEIPRAQWYPTAGATAQLLAGSANNSTASYMATPDVDIPRIGGTRPVYAFGQANWTPYPSTLVGVGANQELFDFGRIAAQSAVADAEIEAERQRGAMDSLDVELAVRETYLAVNSARAVLQAAEDAFQRETLHRNMAQAWVSQGLRSRIELERAEADLARFDVARIRARGELGVAQAAFAASVGVPDPLLDAANGPGATVTPDSLADALAHARSHDPLVLQLLAEIRAQEARTRAITAEALPDVSLTAAVTARAGGSPDTTGNEATGAGFVPVVPNWDVGLLLNWPIFDATVWARRRASQRSEEVLRAQLDVVRQAQVAGVQEAWIRVDEAQRALPALQRAVDAARLNYEQADARYRQGLGSSVELADAEALRVDAEVQLAVGQFQVARERARLARVIAEGP